METGLCAENSGEPEPAEPSTGTAGGRGTRAKNPKASFAVTLREQGLLPAFGPTPGDPLDPSPLRGLSEPQRARRLVGLLELLASWGDGAAAAEALRHHRWQVEMRRGKAPQRVDLNAMGEIRVIDTLSAPAGTPFLAGTRRGPGRPRTRPLPAPSTLPSAG